MDEDDAVAQASSMFGNASLTKLLSTSSSSFSYQEAATNAAATTATTEAEEEEDADYYDDDRSHRRGGGKMPTGSGSIGSRNGNHDEPPLPMEQGGGTAAFC